MGLDVPNRVHIMPVGYERDRVTMAAQQYKADQIVLLTHEENDAGAQEHLVAVKDELESLGIPFEVVETDLFDLYSSLGEIATLITGFENDDVYVNVSTGSKITAIAGMIASMVTGATAYYIKAKDYDEWPRGIEKTTQLPHYPIDPPEEEQVAVLTLLQRMEVRDKEVTKGDVIHFAQHNALPFISESSDGKGNYRLLDTHILDPLQERGYITERKQGRNKIIELTEDGKGAVTAFECLIESEGYEWGSLEDDRDT